MKRLPKSPAAILALGSIFTLVSSLFSVFTSISSEIRFLDIARTLSSYWDVTYTPFFAFALFRYLDEHYEPRLLLRIGSSLRIYSHWLFGFALPWTLATAALALLVPALFTAGSSHLLENLKFATQGPQCPLGNACSTEAIPTLALLSQEIILYCLFVVILGLIILLMKSRGWAGERMFFTTLILSQFNYALYYLGTFSSVFNIWEFQWWYDPIAGLEYSGFRFFSIACLLVVAVIIALTLKAEFSYRWQNLAISLFGASFWLLQAELIRGSGESFGSFLAFFSSTSWATSNGFFKALFLALAFASSVSAFASLKGRFRWLGMLALPAMAVGFQLGGGFWELESSASTWAGLTIALVCLLTLSMLEIRHGRVTKYLAVAMVVAGAKYVPGVFAWAPIGVLIALEIRGRKWESSKVTP